MTNPELLRRRSPSWVRQWSSADLHAVAMRFDRQRREMDLSEAQEWLWDGIVSELEYRYRDGLRTGRRPLCTCWLCFGPFEAPPPSPS